jgi:1-acyl-sn-glycerol-3-phosphate acyltransferase
VAVALANGELVCLFPEGGVTADGELARFRPGVARIIERTPVPVVPMGLSGLWGSVFSRQDGAVLARPWRARPFRRIAIAVGLPLAPSAAEPEALREQGLALRGELR